MDDPYNRIQLQTKLGLNIYIFIKSISSYARVRPDPNAAPLMCRTKLNKVRLRSDFGATADSYGVPAPNLIREACGKQFSMRKYAL